MPLQRGTALLVMLLFVNDFFIISFRFSEPNPDDDVMNRLEEEHRRTAMEREQQLIRNVRFFFVLSKAMRLQYGLCQ